MDGERERRLEVDGTVVGSGTAVYDRERGTVYWIESAWRGFVGMETVNGHTEISRGEFEDRLRSGRYEVSAQPPGFEGWESRG